MNAALSRPVAFTVLVFVIVISSEEFEIEARPKEVIPVPGWFNSVEGFVIPNLKKFEPTDPTKLHARHIINVASEEAEKLKKKKRKKRKKLLRDISKKLQDEEIRKFEGTKKKKKKKKTRKPKPRSIFVKSSVKDKENNSVLSQSKEDDKKPVDIIVHIKMNNN